MRKGKVGKQRSVSVAKKRCRCTNGGKGKVMISKAAHNHLLLQKSKKQKSKAANLIDLKKSENKKMERMFI